MTPIGEQIRYEKRATGNPVARFRI